MSRVPINYVELLILYSSLFLISGMVTGVAGFGFAVLSTVALTSFIEPTIAVALVIPSFILVNASLITNLNYGEFKSCVRRFYPYVTTILVTSIIGMLSVNLIPEVLIRALLGFLTLIFVVFQLEIFSVGLIETAENKCFVESPQWMVIIGGLSGLVFGSTNIGVQMVAYLESCNLRKRVFAGVIGMTFIGVNIVRFGVAVGTEMYPGTDLIILSIALGIPSSVGVFIGDKLQKRVSDEVVSKLVYILLTLIGLYLILSSLNLL